MKIHDPKDIKVGEIYNHPLMMGERFLGVGMRKLYTSDGFENKHLIIFSGDDIGRMIQEGENCDPEIWEMGFRTEDDEDSFYIMYSK
jgi:hypothetical protein